MDTSPVQSISWRSNYTAVSESLLDPDDEPEDVDSDSVEPSEEFESLSQLPDELLES